MNIVNNLNTLKKLGDNKPKPKPDPTPVIK